MNDPIFASLFGSVIKYGLLAFLFMYIIFAAVVVKQINVMTSTVKTGFEGFIKALGILHFLFSIVVFLYSLTIV